MKDKLTVLNIFGAPGSGKSTGAAAVFSMLKVWGVSTELVTESAKDAVWDGAECTLQDQAYILGEQSRRLSRLRGKVDVAVTDSPLLLSIVYNRNPETQKSLPLFCKDLFDAYNNINYYFLQHDDYSQDGRVHTKTEADEIGNRIIYMLHDFNVPYIAVSPSRVTYERIARSVYFQRATEVLHNE